jgi:hypothetical protein
VSRGLRAFGFVGVVAVVMATSGGAVLASVDSDVTAGRFYVGTIGNGGSTGSNRYAGSPIRFQVSANGKEVTGVSAAYTCMAIGYGTLASFPNAPIVHGAFKTVLSQGNQQGPAGVVIEGHFQSKGRATGTITGASEIPGRTCLTDNPWSMTVQPSGYGLCSSVSLSDSNAKYVAEVHVSCKEVSREIRKGYVGLGKFQSVPGWKCHRATVPVAPGDGDSSGGHYRCTRTGEMFQFAII